MRGYRPGAPECRQSECDEGRNRADERRAASAGLSRRAADTLRSGLLSILDRHGEVHMVGSYVLGLMTSRDLDIHVVRADLDVRAFFDLGGEIARLLKPHRMHFRDESTAGTVCLTGSTGESTWVTNATVLGRATYGRRIVRRTSWCADSEMICQPSNDRNRAEILEIKAACWRYPQYRRGFHKRRCLCGRARSRRWAMSRDFGRIFTIRRASRNRLFEARSASHRARRDRQNLQARTGNRPERVLV
jgi:hypothetical protein